MGFGTLGGGGGGGGGGTVTTIHTTSPILGGDITVVGTISFDENADFNWGGAHNFSVALPQSGIVPVNPTDLVNLAFVEAFVAGLNPQGAASVWTDAPLPAYTAAGAGVGKTITINSVGVLTIDGYATVLDDVVGIKDGADPVDFGLYKVTTEGTAGVAAVLTRLDTFDTTAEVKFGSFFGTLKGTNNVGKVWIMISPDPVVVDTDPINFSFFFTGTSYTASAGVKIVGTDIEADLAPAEGLTISAGQIAVDYDNATIGISGGKLAFIGDSDDVPNASGVSGANVSQALDALGTLIAATVQSVTGYYVDNSDPINPVITAPKNNFSAAASPSVNDDSSLGYSVNSQWAALNAAVPIPQLFTCKDATVGAAVWILSEPGTHLTTVDPTVNDDSTLGYYIGTIWINANTNNTFICKDNTATGAVWYSLIQTLTQVLTAGNTTSLSAIFSGSGDDLTISPGEISSTTTLRIDTPSVFITSDFVSGKDSTDSFAMFQYDATNGNAFLGDQSQWLATPYVYIEGSTQTLSLYANGTGITFDGLASEIGVSATNINFNSNVFIDSSLMTVSNIDFVVTNGLSSATIFDTGYATFTNGTDSVSIEVGSNAPKVIVDNGTGTGTLTHNSISFNAGLNLGSLGAGDLIVTDGVTFMRADVGNGYLYLLDLVSNAEIRIKPTGIDDAGSGFGIDFNGTTGQILFPSGGIVIGNMQVAQNSIDASAMGSDMDITVPAGKNFNLISAGGAYTIDGTPGFTGSGLFTNWVIQGGIITGAS